LSGLISLPIGLVLGLLVLDLSDLLDLIVANVELLTFEVVVVQVLLSLGSIVGLLEANEGESVTRFTLVETNFFDLSKLTKELLDLLFLAGWREILDEKVASLLGCFVSDGLSLLLSISLELAKSASDDELRSFDLFLVQGLDGLAGASGSVLLVMTLRIVVANESESTKLRLLEEHGLDGTVRLEELADLFVGHSRRKVFNVDVVDELSHGRLVVSGLEGIGLNTLRKLLPLSSLEGLAGGLGVLETNEAVSI